MQRDDRLFRPSPALMGVCSHIADWADVDPLLVRVNAIIVGIIAAPVVVPAYLLAAWTLEKRLVAC